MEFAERLKELAKKHGGNIGLAKKLNMSVRQIGNYTQKKPIEPKINFLYKIAMLKEEITKLKESGGKWCLFPVLNLANILLHLIKE